MDRATALLGAELIIAAADLSGVGRSGRMTGGFGFEAHHSYSKNAFTPSVSSLALSCIFNIMVI